MELISFSFLTENVWERQENSVDVLMRSWRDFARRDLKLLECEENFKTITKFLLFPLSFYINFGRQKI